MNVDVVHLKSGIREGGGEMFLDVDGQRGSNTGGLKIATRGWVTEELHGTPRLCYRGWLVHNNRGEGVYGIWIAS